MEEVVTVIVIIFLLFMLYSLFKYARFIHEFPKEAERRQHEQENPTSSQEENKAPDEKE